jgi:hypothetical protein
MKTQIFLPITGVTTPIHNARDQYILIRLHDFPPPKCVCYLSQFLLELGILPPAVITNPYSITNSPFLPSTVPSSLPPSMQLPLTHSRCTRFPSTPQSHRCTHPLPNTQIQSISTFSWTFQRKSRTSSHECIPRTSLHAICPSSVSAACYTLPTKVHSRHQSVGRE